MLETLEKEKQYMEHILGKVKHYFKLSEDTALIDLEMLLNKTTKLRTGASTH